MNLANAHPVSKIAVVFFLLIMIQCGCGRKQQDKSEGTILKSTKSIEELSKLANDQNNNRETRCKGIFTLFANYVEPGHGPSEIAMALPNPDWLDDSDLHGIYSPGVQTLIEQGYNETQFSIRLLSNEDVRSDWVIYFTLSGKPNRERNEAIDFLKGKPSRDDRSSIVEFSLCFPNGRIERFSEQGISVSEQGRNADVLEWLFKRMISECDDDIICFIDFGDGNDPPSAFLRRLSDTHAAVRGVSEIRKDSEGNVRGRRNNGKRGYILTAKVLGWIDQNTVEVEYGRYHSPLNGYIYTGILHYREGAWELEPTGGIDY